MEKFPLASSVLYVVPEGIEHEILTSSDARILAFRKAIDYSIWEIKNKLNVIRDFVSATDSLKKTLTIANVVRKVKKVTFIFLSFFFF